MKDYGKGKGVPFTFTYFRIRLSGIFCVTLVFEILTYGSMLRCSKTHKP